jgi:hypothetical protein
MGAGWLSDCDSAGRALWKSTVERKRPLGLSPTAFVLSRRRPTFPRSYPRSIIGDAELNCRVRNGNGCDLRSMTTGNLSSGVRDIEYGLLERDARCRSIENKANMVKSNDRLVQVS